MHDFILLDHVELRHRSELILRDVSGKIPLHGVHLCQGRNGSGKSTFLRAIVGLHPAFKGAIVSPLKPAAIAYLPQLSHVDREFPITVEEFIALGAFSRDRSSGAEHATSLARDSAAAALAREAGEVLGITELGARPIARLSGGQFQKVLLARVHVQDARLIVLDEPFNFLDERAFGGVVELMRRWSQRQKTVVVAAHAEELGDLHLETRIRIAEHRVEFSPAELRILARDQGLNSMIKEPRDLPFSRK